MKPWLWSGLFLHSVCVFCWQGLFAPATFLKGLSLGISVGNLNCLGVRFTLCWKWLIASAFPIWEAEAPDPLSQDGQNLMCTTISLSPQGVGSKTPQQRPSCEDAQDSYTKWLVQWGSLYPWG